MSSIELIKIIILTGIFYVIWKFFLGSSNVPKLGRFWLLGSMILPIFLVKFNLSVQYPVKFNLPAVYVSPVDEVVKGIGSFSLLYVYITISFLIFISLLLSFIKIWSLKNHSILLLRTNGIKIYEGEGIKRPFVFGREIFLPSDLEKSVRDIVIKHEISHIHQKHYLDIVFMELLSVFLWFNPFVWIIKNEIKLLHELLADMETIKEVEPRDYINALAVFSGFSIAPMVSMFAPTKIKKRISMLIQTPKPKPMRVLVAVVAFFMAASLSIANVAPDSGALVSNDTIAPEFPGGSTALRAFVANNIVYPEQARKNKWQDVVIVEFTVDKDGKVKNPHVIKGNYKLLNDEALRVINLFPDFKPAIVAGKPVEATVKIPIVFRLQ